MKDQREQQAREHELKTWPDYFEEVWKGTKNFEIRKNDRNFQIGDILWLREYDKETDSYSGREIKKKVTYVLDTGGEFGLEKGNVCMGLTDFSTHIERPTLTISDDNLKDEIALWSRRINAADNLERANELLMEFIDLIRSRLQDGDKQLSELTDSIQGVFDTLKKNTPTNGDEKE